MHDVLKRQNILNSGALAIETPNVPDIRAHNAVYFSYIFNNESNNDPSLIRIEQQCSDKLACIRNC